MGDDPDWLPEGWEVSVRVRGSGKRDKYYINHSNGLKYNSKPELLRYLKSAGQKHQSKELRSMDKQSDMIVKKMVADKLPPGWIKEIRTKRKGGKTRRDPYYIDPISGRHFRSMKEVSRYLETTDSGRAEHKPDDKGHANKELGHPFETSSTRTNKGGLNKRLITKNATGNKRLASGSTGARMEVEAPNVPNKPPPPPPPAIEMGVGTTKDKRSAINHVQSSSVGYQTLQSGSEVSKNKGKLGHKNKMKRLSDKWMDNLPRRTSKRLTCAEADSSPQVKTRNNANAEAPVSCDAETNSAEKAVNCDPAKEHSMKWIREHPTDNKLKDLDILPNRDDEKVGKHLDSSLKDLLMDPCIKFAIKTLSGVIPIEDMNEVKDCPVPSNPSPHQISDSGFSSVSPPGDLWSDPCFEFAVKTLKGDIPMECSNHTRVSFEQSSSSSKSCYYNSTSLPQFRPNSFYPSSDLYHNTFTAPEMPQISIQFPCSPYEENDNPGLC